MMKSQTFITLLPLLLLTSITTTIHSRPTAISRRMLSTNCDLLFGDCSDDDQWPFDTPISTTNPFMSRPFLRRKTPRLPPIVVASPPPVFTNPYFTPPSVDTNDPTFSPLVASPPPPGYTNDPELSPPFDEDTNPHPPFIGISYSPPAYGNPSPEITLPPIVERNQPDLFMSPPQQNLPAPDMFPVPAPPLVPVDPHQQPEDGGQLPQLPPVAQSPQAA